MRNYRWSVVAILIEPVRARGGAEKCHAKYNRAINATKPDPCEPGYAGGRTQAGGTPWCVVLTLGLPAISLRHTGLLFPGSIDNTGVPVREAGVEDVVGISRDIRS